MKIIETKSQSKAAKATGSARTQARKARRELTKIAAHPSVPKMVSKGVRPHQALLGARASAKLESEEARRYFDSLIVPESGSAQFPDLSDFPTVPVASKYLYSPTAIADSVSGAYYTVIAFFPNLSGAYAVPTGIASGVITWGAFNTHPRYASYVANFANYRTVSMCVRTINSANLNAKTGLFYQDLISERTPNYATTAIQNLPTTLTTITSSPSVRVGSFSNEYLEDVPRAGWLPQKLLQNEFHPMDAIATGSNLVPSYPAIILFCDHQVALAASVQPLTFEVFYNFEAVPLYQTAMLFDPKMCVGSPDKIATGLLENRDTLLEGVNATLKDFQKRVGTIAEYSRVTSQLMSSLGSLGSIGVGSGFRDTRKRNDSELNRLLVVLRDILPSDIDKCHSDSKEIDAFLECVKTLKGLIQDPNFPKFLASEASIKKTAPWKQEVVSIEVSDANSDTDYVVLSAPPSSVKFLKKP